MDGCCSPDDLDSWAKCAVPACTNKCCLSLKSKYCWPHTPGTPHQARMNLIDQLMDAIDDYVETGVFEDPRGIMGTPLEPQEGP